MREWCNTHKWEFVILCTALSCSFKDLKKDLWEDYWNLSRKLSESLLKDSHGLPVTYLHPNFQFIFLLRLSEGFPEKFLKQFLQSSNEAFRCEFDPDIVHFPEALMEAFWKVPFNPCVNLYQ